MKPDNEEHSKEQISALKNAYQKIDEFIAAEIATLNIKKLEKEEIVKFAGNMAGQQAEIHLWNEIDKFNQKIIILEEQKTLLLDSSRQIGKPKSINELITKLDKLRKELRQLAETTEGKEYSQSFKKNVNGLWKKLFGFLSSFSNKKIKRKGTEGLKDLEEMPLLFTVNNLYNTLEKKVKQETALFKTPKR